MVARMRLHDGVVAGTVAQTGRKQRTQRTGDMTDTCPVNGGLQEQWMLEVARDDQLVREGFIRTHFEEN